MSRHYKASANSCNVARLLRAFFCAFLLFGLLPAEAATTTAVAEISADTEILDLNPYLEYLPDEQGRLTIDDVSRPPLAGDFKRNTQKVFNAGLTAKPYWYRLILKYGSATVGRSNQEWFLEIGDAYLDYVDFYAAGPDGEWRVIHTGEQLPFSDRPVRHRNFIVPLELQPARPVSIYFRVRTDGAHQVSPKLWSATALSGRAPDELALNSLYYGIILAMVLYHAIIFVAIRDRSYLDYVLLLVFFSAFSSVFDGLGEQYVWGDWPGWADTNTIALTTLNMGVLFLARFTQSFLRTDQQAPRFDVLLSLLAFTALGCALLGLALPFAATLRVSILLLMLTVAVQMTITVILSLKGQRPARFFLLAWVSSFVGIPISTAYFAGAISGDTLAANASRISTVIGVILFSLALADRFNLERRERMRLGRLKRFFSPQVAAAILEESEEALLAPKRRDVTVVFTDLRGFTEFSANSEPEEVIQVLREYHQVVGNTVAKHHGTLEHFAGDGVMVYFNAPLEIDDPEGSAMRMAFELRDQFEKLCQEWRRRGHSLGIGIGMASGYATVGAVGFEGRRDYAAIGTVTNLAARLCSQAEHGRILVSQRLFTKIEGLVEAENLGEREVKGMPKPIAVYSLTQLKAA